VRARKRVYQRIRLALKPGRGSVPSAGGRRRRCPGEGACTREPER